MRPVDPYKKPPNPPLIALMMKDGTIVDETGREIDPENWPFKKETGVVTRAFAFHETVRARILAGEGEGLCWRNEEIRWRHRPFEEGWRLRESDVSVIKLPEPENWQKALRSLGKWRDWLAENGAVPTGTTGGSAWSLLRSCLRKRLWLGVGKVPPLLSTLGGRQELGSHGVGSYRGTIEQLDLPAAYASAIGQVVYGGRWVAASEWPTWHGPEWWSQKGCPTFVKATVKIPDLLYGPLPKRPTKKYHYALAILMPLEFPVGCQMTGIWTWEEVEAAIAAGCKLQKIHEVWCHLQPEEPRYPFARWWQAIQEGRRQPGLAGHLAKMTGNALWGRFCMDSSQGSRSILSPGKGRKKGKLDRRVLSNLSGQLNPDHALAETVSGRVRAKLFTAMNGSGSELLSAHTDGIWRFQLGEVPGWRQKAVASRLDILNPQGLLYWPGLSPDPVAVWAGTPAERALESFQKCWVEYHASV